MGPGVKKNVGKKEKPTLKVEIFRIHSIITIVIMIIPGTLLAAIPRKTCCLIHENNCLVLLLRCCRKNAPPPPPLEVVPVSAVENERCESTCLEEERVEDGAVKLTAICTDRDFEFVFPREEVPAFDFNDTLPPLLRAWLGMIMSPISTPLIRVSDTREVDPFIVVGVTEEDATIAL